jgi:para-nitrobenzyl esterase
MNRILVLLCVVAIAACETQAQLQTVKISDGLISGTQEEGINVFKGIPYAAAPVGNLRWKAPQAVKNWSGTLKCDEFGASAMQQKPTPYKMWTEEFIPPASPISEDCLYLNVWTPTLNATEKLPVIVWIHGGGFIVGSGSCPIYDGLDLAKKKVVFVTVNYRLGVFGFLAHPALSLESGKKSSGNYGLLDQIAALKWVKKNIEAFGGDATNVTVAGQSAGSMSIQALVLSPLAQGLFQKAIAQSGGFSTDLGSRQLGAVERRGEKLMKTLNIKSIAELREKSATEIMKASANFPFFPIHDGYVLPLDPIEHVKNKKHNDVPFISGWASGDASVAGKKTMTPVEFQEEAASTFGAKKDEFLKTFPSTNQAEVDRSLTNYSICKFTAFPTYLLATNGKKNAYLYQFTFVPTDKPNFPNYGAFHSADIPYALHTLHMWNRPWADRDRNMEQVMSGYWINFARTGDPNGDGLPLWSRYEVDSGTVLELGDKIVSKPGLYRSELKFLSTASSKL